MHKQKKANGVTALDFSKSLLDHGIHAPTNYFPLLVPECLLIEPTETESKETLDEFVEVMGELLELAASDPQAMKDAPVTTPVRRLDDVKAAKELDVAWRHEHLRARDTASPQAPELRLRSGGAAMPSTEPRGPRQIWQAPSSGR